MMGRELHEIVGSTGVYHCMDCGKCTSVCPISIKDSRFSPRKTIVMAVHEGVEALTESELQWLCLTCNMCTIRCPMGVEFIDFIRDIRDHARDRGNGGKCTHGHTIRTWGEMMARDANQPARMGWLTQDLRVSQEGKIGYFVGCLPLFSQFFTGLAPDAVETARSTVRILNRLGIEPVVMGDEVCCGHDFLWSGDRKTFSSLAARNMEAIKRRGIKTLVTACAECFRTLKVDYPWGEAGHAVAVHHTTEYFQEKMAEGGVRMMLQGRDGRMTYHDPCRLSKHMGIIEAPRELLRRVEGLELVEMPHSGARSICCGTSLWMNCGWISKSMQVERLTEARKTGSSTLLTSCPKCVIHLRCAMSEDEDDESIRIEVKDLTTLLAESLV